MPNDTLATLVTASHSKCSLSCSICGSSLNLWLSGLCLSPYFSSDVRAWLQLCTSSCRLLTSPLLPTHHPSNVKSASTVQTQPLTSVLPSIFPWTHTHLAHITPTILQRAFCLGFIATSAATACWPFFLYFFPTNYSMSDSGLTNIHI